MGGGGCCRERVQAFTRATVGRKHTGRLHARTEVVSLRLVSHVENVQEVAPAGRKGDVSARHCDRPQRLVVLLIKDRRQDRHVAEERVRFGVHSSDP